MASRTPTRRARQDRATSAGIPMSRAAADPLLQPGTALLGLPPAGSIEASPFVPARDEVD